MPGKEPEWPDRHNSFSINELRKTTTKNPCLAFELLIIPYLPGGTARKIVRGWNRREPGPISPGGGEKPEVLNVKLGPRASPIFARPILHTDKPDALTNRNMPPIPYDPARYQKASFFSLSGHDPGTLGMPPPFGSVIA